MTISPVTRIGGSGISTISGIGGSGISSGSGAVAPVLSNPTDGTPTSDGCTNATVDTDTGNGTLYWAVVTNGGSATDAQIKAGSGGNIVPGIAGSQVISGTGTQTVASITGLSLLTAYQIKFLQTSAAALDSNQESVNLTTLGDPYFASVVLLACNENGANGTTVFIDQSSLAHTITTVGTAAWTSTAPPTGLTTTLSTPAAGDCLQLADSDDWNFGSGDFTIEGNINPSTVAGTGTIVAQYSSGTAGNASFLIYRNTTSLELYYSTNGVSWAAGTPRSIGTVAINTWYNFSISRIGNNWQTAFNGTQATTWVDSGTLNNSTRVLRIGSSASGGESFAGKIGSIRLTKGVGRYSGSYTPPALPLPTA